VVSYQQLYGWSMDAIVKQIGTRNNCTFCGVFRCGSEKGGGCGVVR
jgi:cytoplasmic tRNA 2-thiolation protein 1